MVNADFFYQNAAGRLLLQGIQKGGLFRLGAAFLKSPVSRPFIRGYIRRNGIDMSRYAGCRYRTFAEFFARKEDCREVMITPREFISPCDGKLSIYPVREDSTIPMKGSLYTVSDLIPDSTAAGRYSGGMCFVFRLEASDYHHFCCFDDAQLERTHFIPGQLHSVQPIACRTYPVFRLNRRWWSILETRHFGTAVQIEIGAMMVGGVRFTKEKGWFERGEEMGNFELCGSTIVLFLEPSVCRTLELFPQFEPARSGETEVRVRMGEGIAAVRDGNP